MMSSPALSETTESVENKDRDVRSPKHFDDPSSLGGKGRLHGWRLYATQFCLAFCLILSVMDSTVVATALVVIGQHFDNFILIQWVVLAYLLTYLGFALILSRLSDIIGRKWTTIASLIILTLASLACGLAQSLNQLIAFRAIQGLGGSGLYSMPFVAMPEITPLNKFAAMSAIIGITLAAAAVLGPLVGGVICTHSTWRWVFLFNVPCGVFLIVLIFIVWPKTESAGKIKWRQLDLIGCLLYLGASVLVVFALQSAGAGTYDWDSVTIIACLVAAGIAAVLFCFWIWFLSHKERTILPLFPARIVNHKEMLVNLFVTTFIGYIFYSLLIQLPQRFQIVNGKTPQTAGLNLLPLSGTSSLGAATGGFLSSKRNNTFYTMTAGNAVILLGCGLLYTVGYDRAVQPEIFGYEVFIGFGVGLIFSSATVLIRVQASERDGASAQGLLSQSRILGGNIGLAISTVVQNHHLSTSSSLRAVLSAPQIKDLQQSLNVLQKFSPQQRQAVSIVFAEAFTSQVLVSMCMAAAGLVAGLFIWQRNPPDLQSKIRAETEALVKREAGEGERNKSKGAEGDTAV